MNIDTTKHNHEAGAHEECAYDHAPNWEDTSDTSGQHWCHVHPLGATEVTRYWCGHTCEDAVCRRYLFVWKMTHPRAVILNALGRMPDGRRK